MAKKLSKSAQVKSKNQRVESERSEGKSVLKKVSLWIWPSLAVLASIAEMTGYSIKDLFQKKDSASVVQSVVQQPQVLLLSAPGQLNLHNRGQSEIYLWGSKFGDTPAIIEKEPRIIPIGAFYYIFTDKLRTNGVSGEVLVPLEVYLSDSLNHHYIAKFNLLIEVNGEDFVIHTQQMGVVQGEWGNL